jgi:hypothetical protein
MAQDRGRRADGSVRPDYGINTITYHAIRITPYAKRHDGGVLHDAECGHFHRTQSGASKCAARHGGTWGTTSRGYVGITRAEATAFTREHYEVIP